MKCLVCHKPIDIRNSFFYFDYSLEPDHEDVVYMCHKCYRKNERKIIETLCENI